MNGAKAASTYEKQLVALGRALQKVRESEQSSTITQTVLQYLRNEFNYTLVWLGFYDSETHTILGQGGITPTGDVAILTQKFVLEPGELLEQVVIQKRLIGVPNLQEVPKGGKWQAAACKLDVQGAILFPIRHRDQCLGVAVLGNTVWGIPAQSDDKARLSMILGELGTALYRLEEEQQQRQSQQPITSLSSVLTTIPSLSSVEDRLSVLVRETHQFLHGDRTHLYWFSPTYRVFWRWIGQPGDKRQSEAESLATDVPAPSSPGMASIRQHQAILPPIPVDAIAEMYRQLAADQMIAVSEADSALQTNNTGALMTQMGGQSLLAVPILFQGELLGFLAVTGHQPRLWSDEEKYYLRAASQIAALMAPFLEPERMIQSIRQDQLLAAEICQAICSREEWNSVLEKCDQELQERFGAQRFLVLAYNESRETFAIAYQSPPPPRQKPIVSPLSPINDVDWALLERSENAIAIEDLEHDLRLMDWRKAFVEADIQSFLVCPATMGNPSNGLIIIAHETPRYWTSAEKDISRTISQQIGVILRQQYLTHELEQRQSIHQAIHGSLATIQKTHEMGKMETASMHRLVDLMDVPLIALIPWEPEQPNATIPHHLVVSNRVGFSLNTDIPISMATDALIQWSLQSDEILSLHVSQLTTDTRQWLNGGDIGQILAVALRTDPDHHPLGLLLVADVAERFWSEYQLEVLEVVGRQLAWSRRYLMLTEKLTARQEELEQLNWYKHQSLEYLCWATKGYVKRLGNLNPATKNGANNSSETSGGGQINMMRYQQILRYMNQLLSDIHPLIRDEQWQFSQTETTIRLVSLLKRSLARVNPLIQQRQLWTKVHNEQNLVIVGDIAKVELVLHEVLSAACRRAPQHSGLDIWCRPLDFNWLELSITDQGTINPQLRDELHHGRPTDWLAHSWLDFPPGLHLAICQSIIQKIGGEFNIYTLEDGRVLSQMTLRIDHGDSPTTTHMQSSDGATTEIESSDLPTTWTSASSAPG